MDVPSGVTGAAAGLGIAGIKALAKKLKEHRAKAFPSVAEYEALQGLKSTEECRAYKAVVKDAILLGACLYGLRLRRIQAEKARVEALKDFIYRRHGGDRLFLAQAVQVGLVLRLVRHLNDSGVAMGEQQRQVEGFLAHIGRHLILVQADSNLKSLELRAQACIARAPLLFCIAGSGTATKPASKLAKSVRDFAYDYVAEPFEEQNRSTVIFSLRGPGKASGGARR